MPSLEREKKKKKGRGGEEKAPFFERKERGPPRFSFFSPPVPEGKRSGEEKSAGLQSSGGGVGDGLLRKKKKGRGKNPFAWEKKEEKRMGAFKVTRRGRASSPSNVDARKREKRRRSRLGEERMFPSQDRMRHTSFLRREEESKR